VDPTDLAFAGLARQAELIAAGEVSSRELTELYLARIARLDPLLNAYRVVPAESALAAADAADARRRTEGDRAGTLNGVPIAIKDDTDVAGELTARGSLAHGGPTAQDAEVVRRLRAAGVVLLGKTHVPELEIAPATESLAFGATRNPWDPARTPGGSSGGSGAAVAAGLAAAALGTDGAGSIRIPAGACGLFGLKPQRGRLPVRPGLHGMTVAGPITRGVLDAARFCDAAKSSGPSFADAARTPPGRLRIAWSVKVPKPVLAKVDEEQRGAVQRTAERLAALGHHVEQRDPEVGSEALSVTTRYLHGIHEEAKAMAHPERLSRRTRGFAAMGARIPAALVRRADLSERGHRARMERFLADIDVLLTPVFTRRPPPIGEWDGLPAPLAFNGFVNFVPHLGLFNHTGQPAAALPVEQAPDGFPVAVQAVGRPDGEPTLLALAAQLEAETGWTTRRPAMAA